MEVIDSANKYSEESEEHGRENLYHMRVYLNHRLLVEIQNLKILLTEDSKGNKEHIIRNQGKGDPCYIVAENSVELCPKVMQKVEFVCYDLNIPLRRFPSKEFKAQPGYSLQLIVKCKG